MEIYSAAEVAAALGYTDEGFALRAQMRRHKDVKPALPRKGGQFLFSPADVATFKVSQILRSDPPQIPEAFALAQQLTKHVRPTDDWLAVVKKLRGKLLAVSGGKAKVVTKPVMLGARTILIDIERAVLEVAAQLIDPSALPNPLTTHYLAETKKLPPK